WRSALRSNCSTVRADCIEIELPQRPTLKNAPRGTVMLWLRPKHSERNFKFLKCRPSKLLERSSKSIDKRNVMSDLKSILLVEDDPKDVELTLSGLAEYNLANEVVVARDGEEALDYLYRRGSYHTSPNGRPAMMLLDLRLPKISGFEVLQQVRADGNLKMIPVVVLTSSNQERDLVKSYKLGVNAYVVKPVDFHQVVNAVKELGVF